MTDKTKAAVEAKKQKILQVAQRRFSRYGFAKTTLDDIAAGVGMQKASLYYYYKNKEDIFRDVIEHETRDFFKTLEQKLSGMDSAVDKIYAFARIRLEFFHQFINLNNLSIDVILEVKPLVDRLYREFRLKQVAYLRDILKQGIATGEIRKCQPPKVANAIFTILEAIAINELQRAEVQDARDIDYKKLEKETNYVLTLLINGLKP